jgi:hypothetical protein
LACSYEQKRIVITNKSVKIVIDGQWCCNVDYLNKRIAITDKSSATDAQNKH